MRGKQSTPAFLPDFDFDVCVQLKDDGIRLAGSGFAGAEVAPTRGGSGVRGTVRTRGGAAKTAATAPSDSWQIEGTVRDARLLVSVRREAGGQVYVKARAHRGADRLHVEFWSRSDGYIGTDETRLLAPVREAMLLLFASEDAPRHEGLGRIRLEGGPRGDRDPIPEPRMDHLGWAATTDESWKAYQAWLSARCAGELWHEPLEHLACGDGSPVLRIAQSVRKLAPRHLPVLILGDTGTGKELIAKAIHEGSKRQGPYRALNCSKLTTANAWSELFGHRKGSFTGASQERGGAFMEANYGTLFLDEIGKMLLEVQPQLLRTLETHTVVKLGSSTEEKVDVRMIAATNIDLSEAVERGDFQVDLYSRLNVFHIRVPSLRFRRRDIPALIAFFSRRPASRVRFGEKLYKSILWYDWPRNVRQLERFIEVAAVLASDKENNRLDLPDLDTELLDKEISEGLREAYSRYQQATKEAGIGDEEQALISGIAQAAAVMFPAAWDALGENDVEASRKAIDDAKIAVAQLLSASKPDQQPMGGTAGKNCRDLLLELYPKDEKLVTDILCRVYRSLNASGIRLSSGLESRRYDTFLGFFGIEYDSIRKRVEKQAARGQ